ncbi:MAG: hypothetical protein A2Y14_00080 [Verrucomicrobia bacterium GWF2_51_19]|nr:MAG: hypothetical protein A2Y14_00080 [Verrucomicrobia bacterium GWF2_51_19]HCJ11885.1 hypothetical protein [Opitutae bacterium]
MKKNNLLSLIAIVAVEFSASLLAIPEGDLFMKARQAIFNGSVEDIKDLGLNKDNINNYVQENDAIQSTLLNIAIQAGEKDFVCYFIEKEANPRVPTLMTKKGITKEGITYEITYEIFPIHYLAVNPNVGIAEKLLAIPNAILPEDLLKKDNNGDTPVKLCLETKRGSNDAKKQTMELFGKLAQKLDEKALETYNALKTSLVLSTAQRVKRPKNNTVVCAPVNINKKRN